MTGLRLHDPRIDPSDPADAGAMVLGGARAQTPDCLAQRTGLMLCCWRRGRAAARSAAAGSGAAAGHLGHAAPRPSRHPRAVAGRDRPLRPQAQGRRASRLHRVQRRDHDAAGAGGGRERGGVRQHAQRYALRSPLTLTIPFPEPPVPSALPTSLSVLSSCVQSLRAETVLGRTVLTTLFPHVPQR